MHQHPQHGAPACGLRQAVSGEVEVRPPGAEADNHGDEPDGEGERVGRLVGQSVDHSRHGLAQHDDDEQAEPFGERVGHAERDRPFRERPPQHDSKPRQVRGRQQTPRQHAQPCGQGGAPGQHARTHGRPRHEHPAGAAEFSTVSPCGEQPQHRQHCEQHPRVHGERDSACTARLRDERTQRDQYQDLQQEHAPAAGILVPVQFVVEAAVEPADPHQREHHGEFTQSAPGQMPGQVVGGLGDQYDHDEVVEQFERADHPLARLLTMGTRRAPQLAAQPGPLLVSRRHAGSVGG